MKPVDLASFPGWMSPGRCRFQIDFAAVSACENICDGRSFGCFLDTEKGWPGNAALHLAAFKASPSLKAKKVEKLLVTRSRTAVVFGMKYWPRGWWMLWDTLSQRWDSYENGSRSRSSFSSNRRHPRRRAAKLESLQLIAVVPSFETILCE